MKEPLLDRILARTRQRLERAREERPLESLERKAERAPRVRDFAAALRGPGIRIVAEFKPASPSAGPLRPEAAVETWVAAYEAGGAAAVSVLTEPEFFGSGLDRLVRARRASSLPLLRKDFLLDPYQIVESRAAGADAVLLLVAALDDQALRGMLRAAAAWGMAALVEVHDEAELDRALACGATLVGINHRDLRDLSVDPGVAARLLPRVPERVDVVAESGFERPEQIRELYRMGCRAFLVGTALMRAEDPREVLERLLR